MNTFQKGTRGHLVQFLRERSLVRVVVVGTRYVHELSRLSGDDFCDLGMSVSQGADRYAGIEVQEHIAVNVFRHRAISALHDERIASGVTGRDVMRITI